MLQIIPITLREANEFVCLYHRHNKPVPGSKYQIALSDGKRICGVVIVGRPVARHLDDGYTLEVNRLATDGTKNACSKLYAAAWRVAKNLGYKKLITYIQKSEPGTSLRAAGWKCVHKVSGKSWDCPSRPRLNNFFVSDKLRFEIQ